MRHAEMTRLGMGDVGASGIVFLPRYWDRYVLRGIGDRSCRFEDSVSDQHGATTALATAVHAPTRAGMDTTALPVWMPALVEPEAGGRGDESR